MTTTLPALYTPNQIMLNTYHTKKKETYEETQFEDFTSYKVIDPITIKEKMLYYMGAVLARCWLDNGMMNRLTQDPHTLLLELGIILPSNMHLVVQKERKNRPQVILYENKRRICALQMRMFATR
jgi:hypothetical protein